VEARAAELQRIKLAHGYLEEDEVSLSNETANLEAICAKFDKEHLHTLDEVRFVVEGEGIFDVRDRGDRWVRIFVEAGDLIILADNLRKPVEALEDSTLLAVVAWPDGAGAWDGEAANGHL